jgi:hypothetical protein
VFKGVEVDGEGGKVLGSTIDVDVETLLETILWYIFTHVQCKKTHTHSYTHAHAHTHTNTHVHTYIQCIHKSVIKKVKCGKIINTQSIQIYRTKHYKYFTITV